MTGKSQWWARQIAAMPEFGTARMAGSVSAALYLLCGVLVITLGALVPASGPHVDERLVLAVGVTAVVSGVVIGALPWKRWRRSSTLPLIPLSFALIALHNYANGADGLRYDLFFIVVFVWIGLMHPIGTSLKSAPLMAAAYLAPSIWLHDLSTLVGGMAYALPVAVIVGECASLVAARLHQSEEEVRASGQRFRALVHHSSDVVSVIDAEGIIRWESPAISKVLGYAPEDRVGRPALDFVHPDQLALATETIGVLSTVAGSSAIAEVQVQHQDGSWRWCEARAQNVLDDPAVAGIVVNFTDVTTRHADEAVRRQLAAIVESSNDAITAEATDGTVLSWNSAAERMYGYTAREMVGDSIQAIVPVDRAEELRAMFLQVAGGGVVAAAETQLLCRDGSLIDVSLSMSPVHDATGTVVAIASIARDISAEILARSALADREASFRLLFAANPQPMWVHDAAGTTFLEVNAAAVQHYGYDRETFLATPVSHIGPTTAGPAHHVLADGRVIDVEMTSHRLEFAGQDAVLVAVQDVTERNLLDAQLRHQAFHDSLTGLSNRALFADRVQHALGRRTGSGPILLLLDLDRFKIVNDSLGHAVGDEMLVEVARRLLSSVRTGDSVARLGGDEFAVLLEDCTMPTAERQATRLLRALAQPMSIGGHQVVSTASIGIAAADRSMSAGELLRNADVAMYRAKAAGGGRCQLFHSAMFEAASRRMELTAALRQGLEQDQFLLHYQPIVDLATGHVTAMEALVRWQHPELGMLSPTEFIPVAEESGLIVPLGAWVLMQACTAMAGWSPTAGVSVNLSGVQLADPQVVVHVRDALRVSGLQPSRLVLEITESVVMQNSADNMRRLRALRDLGVRLAVDDFGTGYSSLAYLRAFPVDELKIDRSFVAAMGDDDDSLALVRTIVQLAESLSLQTVAEGVETAAQYDALQSLGCQRVQGYFISPPAPLADVASFAAAATPWHVAAALPWQR